MKDLLCLDLVSQLLFIAHVLFYRLRSLSVKSIIDMCPMAATVQRGDSLIHRQAACGWAYRPSQSAVSCGGARVCGAAQRWLPSFPSYRQHIFVSITFKRFKYIYGVIGYSKKVNLIWFIDFNDKTHACHGVWKLSLSLAHFVRSFYARGITKEKF